MSVGANIDLCTANDWNAIQWAQHYGHKEMAELLQTYSKCIGRQTIAEDLNQIQSYGNGLEQILTSDERQLLDIYYHSVIDSNSLDLIGHHKTFFDRKFCLFSC